MQDPFRLAAVGYQPVEEHIGDHNDNKSAAKAEQEAQRAVERANPAVEHHVGDFDGQNRDHQQRNQEYPADHGNGRYHVAVEVLLRQRQKLGIRVKRRTGGQYPGDDRKISRMKPRTMARSAETSMMTISPISKNVIGMVC